LDDGEKITLCDSLSGHGYSYLFFVYPISQTGAEKEREGIAVYYKHRIFNVSSQKNGKSVKLDQGSGEINVNNSEYQLLESINLRLLRTAGFVKFTHLETNKNLILITTHLISDSRDKDGSHKKEGLKIIKEHIRTIIRNEIYNPAKDSLIFGGDFNIKFYDDSCGKPYCDRNIFGFDNGIMEVPITETEILRLEDVLIDELDNVERISSVTNTRIDWIDYLFYNNLRLDEKNYPIILKNYFIPNEVYPSDHIPLNAKFSFIMSESEIKSEYHKKYIKYKTKYSQLKNKNKN
jgi:exonuclease III